MLITQRSTADNGAGCHWSMTTLGHAPRLNDVTQRQLLICLAAVTISEALREPRSISKDLELYQNRSCMEKILQDPPNISPLPPPPPQKKTFKMTHNAHKKKNVERHRTNRQECWNHFNNPEKSWKILWEPEGGERCEWTDPCWWPSCAAQVSEKLDGILVTGSGFRDRSKRRCSLPVNSRRASNASVCSTSCKDLFLSFTAYRSSSILVSLLSAVNQIEMDNFNCMIFFFFFFVYQRSMWNPSKDPSDVNVAWLLHSHQLVNESVDYFVVN